MQESRENPNANSNNSSFSGQLAEFQLVELVQAMGIGSSTGALQLQHIDGRTGVIFFENGALVGCREYVNDTLTLGAVLQQLDFARAHIIERKYDRQLKEPLGERLGNRLVESRDITQLQLDEALRTQMLWTVREMSLWRTGNYNLTSGQDALGKGANYPPVEASRVALEIIRYQHEWSDLQELLPGGMHTQLQMSHSVPPNHPLVFPASMWRVITRVNAFHTPRRIATSLYQPEMDVARVLALLVKDGVLYPQKGNSMVGLPDVATTIKIEDIELFTLFSRMEQEWKKKKNFFDKLTLIAVFINWTMEALDIAWRKNHMTLPADSLQMLLARENCAYLDNYALKVYNNHIDTNDLAQHFRTISTNSGVIAAANDSLRITYFNILKNALKAVFIAINMRVDSFESRTYYEESWEKMFAEFTETLFD